MSIFPKIEHINDVLPHIKDYPEFIVAEKEHYDVINYLVAHPETFLSPQNSTIDEEEAHTRSMRRECRGLIFDKEGKLIARRLHKFKNVNEEPETQTNLIDLQKPHVILEKLDGSMITPIPIGDHLRWGTKMGITSVAMNAEVFIAHNPSYVDFAWLCIERGQTPIFEWCSPKNRIVVDYKEDRLVLIAVRNNVTGKYWSYNQMVFYGESYGLDVVKTYSGTAQSMEHLIDETRGSEGIEGWIIRFEDGHMIKVKGDWYVQIHKTKENIAHEKNIVALIVDNKLDDIKGFMLKEDLEKLEKFESAFFTGLKKVSQTIQEDLETLREKNISRKDFALNYTSGVNSFIVSIIFTCWDGHIPIEEAIINVIKKNTGSQSRIDNVRVLWNNVRWNYS